MSVLDETNDESFLQEKRTFIKQCAIEAMQGVQESGKFGIALEVIPAELAKISFDIAESMWDEYEKRYKIPSSV